MRRAFGYRPDVPDERDAPFAVHRAALDALVPFASVDLADLPPKDQQASSSCVGNAVAAGLRLAEFAAGRTCPELSALSVYRTARNLDGTDGDEGTYLRSGVRGVQKLGCATERAWPFSMASVDRQLPFSALHDGFDRRGLRGYHRIARGDLDGIRRALAAGLPVVAGWQVTREFASSDGRAIIGGQVGQIAGGHALCLVSYGAPERLAGEFRDLVPDTREERLWRVLNSWGSWGYGGRFYAADSFVEEASDLWALDCTGGAS